MLMTTFEECKRGDHSACPKVYPDPGFGGAFCDCDCHHPVRASRRPEARVDGPDYRKAVELEFWLSIRNGSDADDFELYLRQFPDGQFVQQAKDLLAKLNRER